MTLQAKGTQIGLSDVSVEIEQSPTALITLNDTKVRIVATKFDDSTQISMDDLGGGSWRKKPSYTYSTNISDLTINMSSIPGYLAGKTDLTVTIGTGVYVYSTTTSAAALNITGATTGDTVKIINNGYILGMGGQGGTSTTNSYTSAPSGNYPVYVGFNGGPAISVSCVTTLENNGYICGGGGGGSGGWAGGGGGAGGGRGGNAPNNVVAGGAGGGPGAAGSSGSYTGLYYTSSGGGGGRIVNGTGGAGGSYQSTLAARAGQGGGAGGGGGSSTITGYNKNGGAGGSLNNSAPGTWGNNYKLIGGDASGGGGWGASGGIVNQSTGNVAGSIGGASILRNNNTLITSGSGTVYGAII